MERGAIDFISNKFLWMKELTIVLRERGVAERLVSPAQRGPNETVARHYEQLFIYRIHKSDSELQRS